MTVRGFFAPMLKIARPASASGGHPADEAQLPTGAKPLSSRTLTAVYLIVLTIIAFLSIGSYLALERVIREQEGTAAIVNMSGRQRMLSQRITSMAAQYRLGDPAAREELLAAAALLREKPGSAG